MREKIIELLNTDFSADTSQNGITILFGKGEAQARKADQILKEIGEEIMESAITCGSKDFILPPEVSVELVNIIRQAREEGKRAGIKEAVDWIVSRAIPNSFMPINTRCQWHDQLKEWGIDA